MERADMELLYGKLNKTQLGRMKAALVEFGYATLTLKEVETASLRVLKGEDVGGDVIAMFVKNFLQEAGIVGR